MSYHQQPAQFYQPQPQRMEQSTPFLYSQRPTLTPANRISFSHTTTRPVNTPSEPVISTNASQGTDYKILEMKNDLSKLKQQLNIITAKAGEAPIRQVRNLSAENLRQRRKRDEDEHIYQGYPKQNLSSVQTHIESRPSLRPTIVDPFISKQQPYKKHEVSNESIPPALSFNKQDRNGPIRRSGMQNLLKEEPKNQISSVKFRQEQLKEGKTRANQQKSRFDQAMEQKAKEERLREQKLREERAREERVKEERAREERARSQRARSERAKQERARQERAREDRIKQERIRQERIKEQKMKEDRKKEERLRDERAKQEKYYEQKLYSDYNRAGKIAQKPIMNKYHNPESSVTTDIPNEYFQYGTRLKTDHPPSSPSREDSNPPFISQSNRLVTDPLIPILREKIVKLQDQSKALTTKNKSLMDEIAKMKFDHQIELKQARDSFHYQQEFKQQQNKFMDIIDRLQNEIRQHKDNELKNTRNNFDQTLKTQIDQLGHLKEKISQKDEQIRDLKDQISTQNKHILELNNQLKIAEMAHTATLRQTEKRWEIMMQDKSNDLQTSRRSFETLESRLKTALAQIKEKDMFITNYLVGRSKDVEEQQHIKDVMSKYTLKFKEGEGVIDTFKQEFKKIVELEKENLMLKIKHI